VTATIVRTAPAQPHRRHYGTSESVTETNVFCRCNGKRRTVNPDQLARNEWATRRFAFGSENSTKQSHANAPAFPISEYAHIPLSRRGTCFSSSMRLGMRGSKEQTDPVQGLRTSFQFIAYGRCILLEAVADRRGFDAGNFISAVIGGLLYYLRTSTVSASTTVPATRTPSSFIEEGLTFDGTGIAGAPEENGYRDNF
jgi:hypothetical protein